MGKWDKLMYDIYIDISFKKKSFRRQFCCYEVSKKVLCDLSSNSKDPNEIKKSGLFST